MKVDPSQSDSLFRFASQRLGGTYRHELGHKVLTLIGSRGIVAQAVFTHTAPGVKFELSMWAHRAMGLGGRHFIRSIFQIGFIQWNCKRATAITRASNADAAAGRNRLRMAKVPDSARS